MTKIIGWHPNFGGWFPRMENPGSATDLLKSFFQNYEKIILFVYKILTRTLRISYQIVNIKNLTPDFSDIVDQSK